MKIRYLTKNIGVTYLSLIFFIVLIFWAAFYDLTQTVRAQGQIVSETKTQIIQAADGGVLEKILVNEGQNVKEGQELALLEKKRANAEVNEGKTRIMSLRANLLRAQSEASSKDLIFNKEFEGYPEIIHEQLSLFKQKRKSLTSEINSYADALRLAKDELLINEKLFKSGDVSKLDIMRAKRQVFEIEGKIDYTKNKFIQDAQLEVTKFQDELASQEFKLEERQDVLEHTVLKSPLNGVVKILKFNTVGGVIRNGEELMQISPSNTSLLVEVKINPSDIGQLAKNLPVSIKIDAFDYTIYGSLNGILEYISSDTLNELSSNGQTVNFYKARIKVTQNQVNKKLSLSQLKPGMTASVDIQTGSRSILRYLTKPISKAFQGAASER
jgi:adhesin transport system membrane fusion protein